MLHLPIAFGEKESEWAIHLSSVSWHFSDTEDPGQHGPWEAGDWDQGAHACGFWENISMDCCFRRKPRARLWTVSRMNLCKMPMKILPVKTWGVWVSCEQRKRHHTESLKYQARKMTKKQMKHPPEQCQGGLRDTIFKRESTCKGNREIRLQKDWLPK